MRAPRAKLVIPKFLKLAAIVCAAPLAIAALHPWLFDVLRPQPLALSAALLGLLAYPILEEFIFRGLLHAELRKKAGFRSNIWSVSAANVSVALLFAVAHILIRFDLSLALVFIPALLIGFVYEEFDDNWGVAALTHSWFNLVWYTYGWWAN